MVERHDACKIFVSAEPALEMADDLELRGLQMIGATLPGGSPDPPLWKEKVMLHYALVFLVIALVAGLLGFGGIAGASAGIAKILFLVFIVLFVVSLLAGGIRGRR